MTLLWLVLSVLCLAGWRMAPRRVWLKDFLAGSAAAFVLALVPVEPVIQLAVFALSSLIARIVLGSGEEKGGKEEKKNPMGEMKGQAGHALEAIPGRKVGHVWVMNRKWKAVERKGRPLAKNEWIRVVGARGDVLLVESATAQEEKPRG